MAKLSKNSGIREAKQLLKTKVADMPLDINNRMLAISDNIRNALKNKDKKIAELINAINAKYPEKSVQRGLYEGLSALSMDTVYSLYLMNNNAALIVELQGILERYCNNALCDILPIDNNAKSIVIEALDKKTLKDFAPYMKKLSVWDEEDEDFALKLTDLRNGIAHKNAEVVSRNKLIASNGQSRHPESIHAMMAKVDCTDFIVRTIDLMIKAMGIARPSFIKQPRLYARYQEYTSLIAEMHSLFLTNPYSKMGYPYLETYVNERLARTYIISGEKLLTEIEKYRVDILDFHRALDEKNEKLIKQIHSRFGGELEAIKKAMREDLHADDERIYFDTPALIDIKPYLRQSREKFNE